MASPSAQVRRWGSIALASSALVASVVATPGSASVSSTPAATPQLATSGTDGTVEQVRQIVQCGNTM